MSSLFPSDERSVGLPHGGDKPSLHIQQHPREIGMSFHCRDDGGVRHVVEESLDVNVNHPRMPPAPLLARLHCIQRGPPRAIAIRILMEDLLHIWLQCHGHCRLSDPVSHGRNPKAPSPTAGFGNINRSHRRREVTSRGQPVPQLVQVVLLILLKLR